MTHFIGRRQELEQLRSLLRKSSASLVVIKGRRRIGKSRLIQEFGKDLRMLTFSGIPPTEKMTLKDQLREFGWQLGKELGQPAFKDDDWNDLFLRLASHTREGQVVILFDEISWMGSKDPHFLGKLKNAWDLEFKKNSQLILVLCGSVSTWIERNILNNTGFLGRISLNMTIEELPLSDCNMFWKHAGGSISSYEKFKILSVTGGVPKYLEEIHPHLTAEENIRNLCFKKEGILYNEFEQIFSDIFSRRSDTYKRIVKCIANGSYPYEAIYNALGIKKSGAISEYLEDLVKSGFLKRDYTWHLKTGKVSKLSRYRISDNYLRFYLKYIEPYKDKIERNTFKEQSLSLIPGWEGTMGLQFENLVLNNRAKIIEFLGLKPEDIIYDNPYFQHQTTRQEGCQIDYLIQTRFNTLYICEIKFAKHPIKANLISAMETKLARLKATRRFSCRPVLIHVNGVSEELAAKDYFASIIDFSQMLEG